MKLSVLEQSTLSEGMSAGEAVHATVTLARALDKLGYKRLWLSEHHNMPVLQGSAPEVLLSVITVIGDTREEAERLARAQLYFMCAFRSGEPVQRQMLAEEAAVTDFPTRYEGLLAMFRRTWIIDDAEAGAGRLLALAECLGIDELMINPVAAAYAMDSAPCAPNRRRTLSALAVRLTQAPKLMPNRAG